MNIVGAGLTGLLAAVAFPGSTVFEIHDRRAQHAALLRFRSKSVADMTGIEFRRVQVRKGIYSRGAFVAPNIRIANHYATKAVGLIGDRSIWNTESVERFIAPDDLYDQLVDAVGKRIKWNEQFPFKKSSGPVISTAPLDITLDIVGELPLLGTMNFHCSPIRVLRTKIDIDGEAFQTIYFPDPELSLYRASISGRILIAEFAAGHPSPESEETAIDIMTDAFGIDEITTSIFTSVNQQYGKIAPIDDQARKHAIGMLTERHAIFSLGRFATWRNILLDDVVHDIAVIKRLMKLDTYSRRKMSAYAPPRP